MKRSTCRGFLTPGMYVAIFFAVAGLSGFLYVRHVLEENKSLTLKNATLEGQHIADLGKIETLKGEREAADIRHAAQLERVQEQSRAQVENQKRQDEATAKASAERIQKTLDAKPQKYADFVVKAMEHDAKAINCRSDLRTVNDEKACPFTVH